MRSRSARWWVLVLVLAACSARPSAQTQQAIEIATSVAKDLGLGPLLGRVFDRLMKDKTPGQAARPKVRELYASLLEMRDRHASLLQAVDERVKVLRSDHPDADSLPLSRDELIRSAADAKATLSRLQKAFSELQVDIDTSNPTLSGQLSGFAAGKRFTIKAINVDDPRALGVARQHLAENGANLENALRQLRALTQKVYPHFGELLSPGILG